MSKDLPVGILSTAHVHTDAYAELLAEFSDVDFVGVADTNESDGRETAERYNVSFLETGALLDQVDAAVVCSPNATHHEWIEQAADAGVDVLCEKPLAANREQAAHIVNTCEKSGINAGLVMPLRFNPLARQAKQKYDEDILGELKFITGTNRGKMPGGWFIKPELSGGGAIMDHTVHILNLVRWITGQEVSEVYARSGTHFNDIPVDDICLLSMELEDGTPFTLDGSWSRPDAWDTWGDATLEMLGTDGVISFDSNEQLIKVTEDGETSGIRSVGYGGDANKGSLRNFIEAVRGDQDPLSTIEDGAREVAVVEAAYESVESGKPVAVDY
jgi:UDP-N-acetylglucosamine 3-dehydrogenase